MIGVCVLACPFPYLSRLPWIFPGAPLKVNGASGNIQDNLTALRFWIFPLVRDVALYYNAVIMGAMASQITSLTIVYPTVYSDADQRKHQSSASLAFVRGIHRWPVNSPHKVAVMRKSFHLMTSLWSPDMRIAWPFCVQRLAKSASGLRHG